MRLGEHIVAGGLRMESSKGKMERPHPDANIWALHSAAAEVKAEPGLLGYVIIFCCCLKEFVLGLAKTEKKILLYS